MKKLIEEIIRKRLAENKDSKFEDFIHEIISYLNYRLQPEPVEIDDDTGEEIYDEEDLSINISSSAGGKSINFYVLPPKAKGFDVEFTIKGNSVTNLSVVSDGGGGSDDKVRNMKFRMSDAKKIAKEIEKVAL